MWRVGRARKQVLEHAIGTAIMFRTRILQNQRVATKAPVQVSGHPITEYRISHWKFQFQFNFIAPCYQDNKNRVLKGNNKCIGDRSCYRMNDDMTIEICKSYCRARNWAIAGLESYSECFCGNQISPKVRLPDSSCQRRCRGNSAQICGGHWAMTVYYL